MQEQIQELIKKWEGEDSEIPSLLGYSYQDGVFAGKSEVIEKFIADLKNLIK